ncbi:MAG: 16S rRNA (guanine(527)-N(7))-methyltransferase RsmG [Ruminococcaceae bacterium]|nr:16S rRNA (guanine(527)-N(7))-methyltransferase RsmG [Oscillospiraceae bacterium]
MFINTIKDLIKENQDEFYSFYSLLCEWNEKINLTAITEEYDVATKHFLDCLAIFDYVNFKDDDKIIDIGCGAGFPSVVMGIKNKNINITLLDSLNKRITFLNEVIEKLNLKKLCAIHSRAEDLARDKEHREKYNYAVSRAVANLTSLTELCLPFVKVGGYFIALKGPNVSEEINDAKKAIKLLGGELEKVVNYEIPTTDLKHNLVFIKKISPTSTYYPRKSPKPIKEPLK